MGTRPGQIDPGAVLYLISQKGMSAQEAQRFLYNDCGLKGLSGISSDMRDLEKRNEPGAKLAVDYFVYRAGLSAGALAAALGGLDTFVFTAGIGENSATIRGRIAQRLSWLGAELDPQENLNHGMIISQAKSRVRLCVIPTDEELMIAEHTLTVTAFARTHKESFDRTA
jgi:acetate kinase